MPTPDAHSSQSPSLQPRMSLPTHSMPISPSPSSTPFPSSSSSPFEVAAGTAEELEHKHAIDFATHSWDLATGGLKTLTAKRELPMRPDRRAAGVKVDDPVARNANYPLTVLILACVVLMLIGGGVVLFVMLQP